MTFDSRATQEYTPVTDAMLIAHESQFRRDQAIATLKHALTVLNNADSVGAQHVAPNLAGVNFHHMPDDALIDLSREISRFLNIAIACGLDSTPWYRGLLRFGLSIGHHLNNF